MYKTLKYSNNRHSISSATSPAKNKGTAKHNRMEAKKVRIPLRKTFRFGSLAIPFTLLCQCHSEETINAVGPFYLVSMPGEVKDPTSPHWNM